MHSLYVSSFFLLSFSHFLSMCISSSSSVCHCFSVSYHSVYPFLFLYSFICSFFFFLSISLSIFVCLLFTFSISVTLYLPLLLSCFSCADSTPTHEPLPIWLAFFLSQSPLLPTPPLLELLWF